MRAFSFGLTLLLAASLLPSQAQAAKKKRHDAPAVKEAAPVAPPVQAPVDFADAFHDAMRSRDRTKILPMLAPDLVVFETGYLEATRDDYVKSNLDDDTAFASATDYRPMSRGVIGSGESVTVLTKASIQGFIGGQSVDLVQSETMILRRTATAWEIVHLHWSAHTRQADEPEPHVAARPPVPSIEAGPPALLTPATALTVPVVPEVEPEQPTAELEQPKAELEDPKVEPEQPKAGLEEPKAESEQPKAGLEQPQAPGNPCASSEEGKSPC